MKTVSIIFTFQVKLHGSSLPCAIAEYFIDEVLYKALHKSTFTNINQPTPLCLIYWIYAVLYKFLLCHIVGCSAFCVALWLMMKHWTWSECTPWFTATCCQVWAMYVGQLSLTVCLVSISLCSAVDLLNFFCLPCSRQHLRYDCCLEDEREDLSELFCAALCTTVVHSDMHTHTSSC